MLITLIAVVGLLIGIALLIWGKSQTAEDRGAGVTVTFMLALGFILGYLLVENLFVVNQIKENEIERNAIVTVMNSGLATDVTEQIIQYDKKVYHYKRYKDNLWIGWFYNDKIADSLEYILPDYEVDKK